MKGILLVDKPAGMTSHDVVDRVRKAAGERRIGHTGTLDPSATGLLVLCIGNATRLSEFLTGLDKVYEGTMEFGVVTDSFDLDGAVTERRDVPPLTNTSIQKAFDKYTGEMLQTPPMVSAVKVGGKKLYELARKGKTIDRAPRKVTVSEFKLLNWASPLANFRVRCTRGTYARVLAHDVGGDLGCGAALASLRRTSVGVYSVKDASSLDAIATLDDVRAKLIPVEKALDLPLVTIKTAARKIVVDGGVLCPTDIRGRCPVSSGWIQVKAESGELLALAEVQVLPVGLRIQPKRVLCGQS
jgi:tRNA pseudouridine55 synthase